MFRDSQGRAIRRLTRATAFQMRCRIAQSVRLATERGYICSNIGNHFTFISYCFPLFVFIVAKTSFLVQRSFPLIPQIPRFPLQQQIALRPNFSPGKALVPTAFLIDRPQGTVRWSFRRFAEGPPRLYRNVVEGVTGRLLLGCCTNF